MPVLQVEGTGTSRETGMPLAHRISAALAAGSYPGHLLRKGELGMIVLLFFFFSSMLMALNAKNSGNIPLLVVECVLMLATAFGAFFEEKQLKGRVEALEEKLSEKGDKE